MFIKFRPLALIAVVIGSSAPALGSAQDAALNATAMERFFSRMMTKHRPAGVVDGLPPSAALEATEAECDGKCEINVIAFRYAGGLKCATFIPLNVVRVYVNKMPRPTKIVFKLVNVIDKDDDGKYQFVTSGVALRKPESQDIPAGISLPPAETPSNKQDYEDPAFEPAAKDKMSIKLIGKRAALFAYTIKTQFVPKGESPIRCDDFDPLIANQ